MNQQVSLEFLQKYAIFMMIYLGKKLTRLFHLRFRIHSKLRRYFECQGPGTSLILKELPLVQISQSEWL